MPGSADLHKADEQKKAGDPDTGHFILQKTLAIMKDSTNTKTLLLLS